MTFFFDRCVGIQVPKALQVFRRFPVEVRYHQEVFGDSEVQQALPDDVWMADVARKGWVVVTQDHRFQDVPATRDAVKQHGAGVFYIWGAQAPAWETTRILLWALPRMLENVRASIPPYVYRVRKDVSIHPVRLV